MGRFQPAPHDGIPGYLRGVLRLGGSRILVHKADEQRLIQGPPVHPDPDRLGIFVGHLDHAPKVLVPVPAGADVSGVDAVFGQGSGAIGIAAEQKMPVVVKIADQRDIDPQVAQPDSDLGDRPGCPVVVYSDPNQLRARQGQRGHLAGGGGRIGGVGVGHGLNHHRVSVAHHDRPYPGRYRLPPSDRFHPMPPPPNRWLEAKPLPPQSKGIGDIGSSWRQGRLDEEWPLAGPGPDP